ncbi:MAG: phytoene desaturase family protein [Spirochaetota bacterium]
MQKKKVVIIGAGYGGLSAAAFLARDGFDVTVLEKNEEVGGRARLWESEGYSFDMGPSWYLMPEVFERFFSLFDHKSEDFYTLGKLDPYYKVFFSPEESVLIRPDLAANARVFDAFEPGGGEALRRYVKEASYKYNVAMENFLYREYKKITDFFNKQVVFEGTKLHVFKKLDAYVRTYVQDRRARQILEYAMVFLGTDPKAAPALYSIMSHVDLEGGVYFPKGGMNGVAQGIAQLCKDLGVTIHTDQEVISLQTYGGRVTSVVTRNGSFQADVVVSGADYQHVESMLLDVADRSYSESYWKRRVVAPSMFIAYLGIRRRLEGLEHHNLFFQEKWEEHFDTIFKHPSWPQDPCFYLSCITKTDPSMAPQGCENVFLLVPTAPGLDDTDDTKREEYYQHVIEHVEKITGESLSDDVALKRIYSHRDFISDYHAYGGTALGLSHTLLQTAVFRPSHKSKKVANLFSTGQYTHPGVGVPMTLIASEIVAKRIQEELWKSV